MGTESSAVTVPVTVRNASAVAGAGDPLARHDRSGTGRPLVAGRSRAVTRGWARTVSGAGPTSRTTAAARSSAGALDRATLSGTTLAAGRATAVDVWLGRSPATGMRLGAVAEALAGPTRGRVATTARGAAPAATGTGGRTVV